MSNLQSDITCASNRNLIILHPASLLLPISSSPQNRSLLTPQPSLLPHLPHKSSAPRHLTFLLLSPFGTPLQPHNISSSPQNRSLLTPQPSLLPHLPHKSSAPRHLTFLLLSPFGTPLQPHNRPTPRAQPFSVPFPPPVPKSLFHISLQKRPSSDVLPDIFFRSFPSAPSLNFPHG